MELISMLEKLLSQMEVDEKKRILASEYGMIMTTELEGRIQTMCNLSLAIEEKSIEKERLDAITRMIKVGATKEQILLYGYTEEELAAVERKACVNI